MKLQQLFEMSLNVIDKTNMDDVPSLYARYFTNPQYFIREKNIHVEIVDMDVSEYLSKAKALLSTSWGRPTLDRSETGGSEKISHYADLMRSGVKFPVPYLNYIDNDQQGMHRVEAARSIGVTTIPVMIIKRAR